MRRMLSHTLQDHDHRVAETAVVGFPHDIFGEGEYMCVCALMGETYKSAVFYSEPLNTTLGMSN